MTLEQLKLYSGESIIDKSGRYTFEDLLFQIDKYEREIDSVISKNDIIVIDSDYSFYSIALLLALSKVTCIIVPIVKTTETEFTSKIVASQANMIIRFNKNHSILLETIKTEKSEYFGYLDILTRGNSGLVLFSSGTTGNPKVLVHNFTFLLKNLKPPLRQKNLKFLLFLMFDHIGGLNTLLGCLNNGSTIIIPENRNPDNILDLVEKEKIQVLPTSPTFLNLMLQVETFEKRDFSSLKLISYGTEKMPQVLLERLNKLLPNVKLLQTFGTSETGILKTQSKSSSNK